MVLFRARVSQLKSTEQCLVLLSFPCLPSYLSLRTSLSPSLPPLYLYSCSLRLQDYLGTCKGGCIIKRRKGRAYVAKLIYFGISLRFISIFFYLTNLFYLSLFVLSFSGFLFSSSRSDQVDFLMASDGSSNFTLADRMVKLSNFLTLVWE